MLKVEFEELKLKLLDVIVKFELLQRKSNYYKQLYLVELADEIKDEFILNIENEIMLTAIKNVNSGVGYDVVKKEIFDSKEELRVKEDNFNKNLESAKNICKRYANYSNDEIVKLDEDFILYCNNYHPIIKGKTSENERMIYTMLSKMYREGNVEAFYKIYEEFKGLFSVSVINENEYDGYALFYNESINNLNGLISNMVNSFPLNIEDKFTDYINMTALIGEKRESNYKLKELNKVIKADFILNFDFEF